MLEARQRSLRAEESVHLQYMARRADSFNEANDMPSAPQTQRFQKEGIKGIIKA